MVRRGAIERVRLVAVAPGEPRSVDTFAGISAGLLDALESRGALAGAVNGRARWLERVERASALSRDAARRAQSYEAGAAPLSTVVRGAMGETVRRRAEPMVRAADADATLQLTSAWETDVPGALRVSYHTTNLAAFLCRPDLHLDPCSRRVRRARAWERRLYDEMDLILPASAWLRETFLDAYEQPPDKVVAVGLGRRPTAASDRDWTAPRFLVAGDRWEHVGGPELLRAWPAVRAALPAAELTITGAAAPAGPLPAGVALAGGAPPPRPISGEATAGDGQAAAFRTATVLVHLPSYAPVAGAVLDAMAHGLPCVVSDRGALPELVADGTTGRVVDPDDPDALAGALIEVAAPATAARLGAGARARHAESFTWDAVADRILAAIAGHL